MTSQGREGRSLGARLWVPLALLACGYVYLIGIGTNPAKWEEPRRMLVAIEMIERGDYVVPRVLGEIYRNKPPFHAWLITALALNDVENVVPRTARLVSLLSLAGICVALWRLGLGENRAPHPLPAWIFATTATVVQFGRAGEIDLPFTCSLVLAFASFELGRRRDSPVTQWILSQAFIAIGTLLKGFAPLFFYPPILWWVWRNGGGSRRSLVPAVAGLVLASAICAGWILPYHKLAPHGATGELGARFVDEIRAVTTDVGVGRALLHVVTYPLLWIAIALPWSLGPLLRPGSIGSTLRGGTDDTPYLSIARAVVCWGALVYLFVPGTDGRYLLPFLPAAAVLLSLPLVSGAPWRGAARLVVVYLLPTLSLIYLAVGGFERLGAAILLPLGIGVALAIAALVPRHDGLARATAPLALLGLLYGLGFASIWESRRAEKTTPARVAAEKFLETIGAEPERPVICNCPLGEGRRIGYYLSHGRSRTLRSGAPDGRHFLVGTRERVAGEGRLVAEHGAFQLRDVSSVETVTPEGTRLRRPFLGEETLARFHANLGEARARWEANPEVVENWIWLGRRTAYLGRYREAVEIYGEALDRFPDEPRLLRHRGHRYVTLRKFDQAIEDLERASRLVAGTPNAVEPDGLPNARNIPTSTTQGNIWYHLGLTYYVLGEFEQSERCYREAVRIAGNPDSLCAASYWLYLSLRRQGRTDEARSVLEPIVEGLDVIENDAYYELLLIFRGLRSADELVARLEAPGSIAGATLGYGIGAWHRIEGREGAATRTWQRVLSGNRWDAFGYIAAEAEFRHQTAQGETER